MSNYVECGYVEDGYFDDNCNGLLAIVKVFGFSRTSLIKPTIENPASKLVSKFNSKYGRNAFAFPAQKLGK